LQTLTRIDFLILIVFMFHQPVSHMSTLAPQFPSVTQTPRDSKTPQMTSHRDGSNLAQLTPRQRSSSFMPSPVCDDPGELNLPLSTGDVICVKGSVEGIMRLGATGGYMGHVLLVLAPPVGVQRNSVEAAPYKYVWPRNARMLWVVRTGESCRDAEGFHETDLLLHVDRTGHVLIIGEVTNRGEESEDLIQYEIPAKAQLFCCPSDLRSHCRLSSMNEVLDQIRNREASWSWGTAVRAFLFSADVSEGWDPDANLKDIKKCWQSAPICTSVVIIFWQQYMCKLAHLDGDSHAMDWILEWMPVKADRTLPGELLSTMERCGWEVIDCIGESRNRARSV
jgi:hypothetical protein